MWRNHGYSRQLQPTAHIHQLLWWMWAPCQLLLGFSSSACYQQEPFHYKRLIIKSVNDWYMLIHEWLSSWKIMTWFMWDHVRSSVLPHCYLTYQNRRLNIYPLCLFIDIYHLWATRASENLFVWSTFTLVGLFWACSTPSFSVWLLFKHQSTCIVRGVDSIRAVCLQCLLAIRNAYWIPFASLQWLGCYVHHIIAFNLISLALSALWLPSDCLANFKEGFGLLQSNPGHLSEQNI